MARAINVEQYFAKFSDTFSPKVVGELNGQHVKLVRRRATRCRGTPTTRGRAVPGSRRSLEVHERGRVTSWTR